MKLVSPTQKTDNPTRRGVFCAKNCKKNFVIVINLELLLGVYIIPVYRVITLPNALLKIYFDHILIFVLST